MKILKQYYNEAGQLLSRETTLASREFYRDVMCRHKFNEMFLYTRNDIGIGCSINSDEVYYDFTSNYSSAGPVFLQGDMSRLDMIDIGGGRKGLINNAISSGESLSSVIGFDDANSLEFENINIGFIAKTPSERISNIAIVFIVTFGDSSRLGVGEYKRIEISFTYSRTYEENFIQIYGNPVWSGLTYSQIGFPQIEALMDGGVHVFELKIISGTASFLIDGTSIFSNSISSAPFPLSEPGLILFLPSGDNQNMKPALDSAWIRRA